MKKFFLSALMILLTVLAVLAADNKTSAKPQWPRGSVYAEFLGTSGIFGVSYDARFYQGTKFGYRVGLSYGYEFGRFDDVWARTSSDMAIQMPIGVNGLFGSIRHKLEVGAGIVPTYNVDNKELPDRFNCNYFLELGYRYQRPRGFLFRCGVTAKVHYECAYVIPFMAFGYSF